MTVAIAETADLDAVRAVRRMVFVLEQGVSEAEEWDGHDGAAIHLAATENGAVIGTARLMLADGVGRIGRVAVLAAHRRRGIGRDLVLAAVEVLRDRGAVRAVLGSQVAVIGFYERLGFRAYGPRYDDAGIPHRAMDRTL